MSEPTDDLTRRIHAQEQSGRDQQLEASATLALVSAGERPLPTVGPALQAATAVGRALGLEIEPPRLPVALTQSRNEPFEEIARATQLRIRPVRLRSGWWRQDAGPLLGYLATQHRPVALLCDQNGAYECLDPESGSRVPVTAEMASQLEPRAFMLYRPLPHGRAGLWRLFRFGMSGAWRDLAIALVLSMVVALLSLLSLQAIGVVVDQAIPSADRFLLGQIGVGLLLFAAAIAITELARNILMLRAETTADHTLQSAVWDRLLRLRLGFFRGFSAGDVLSRVTAVDRIRRYLSGSAARTALSSGFGLLYISVLVMISPSLALLALGVGLLAGGLTVAAWLVNFRPASEMMQLEGSLTGLVVQLVQLIPKVRVAAAEDRAFAYWGLSYARQKRLRLEIDRVDELLAVGNEAVGMAATIALFAVAVSSGSQLALPTGLFLAFLVTYRAFLESAHDLSFALVNLLPAANLWGRVQPILDAELEVQPGKTDPGILEGQVRVERASFRYRAGGPFVLRDVSIDAKPGEFVAVVGRSGSGKTTLLRLLLGFDAPESGRVLYDGQDLADLDLYAVRRQWGVVIQEGRVLQGSIYRNIAAGASVTLEEVEEAARLVGLDSDLERMPMGLHTLLSDGGGNLSGGQRQRLLIARGLVRRPRLLLLDEATSALDNRSQDLIIDNLRRMNATRIVIAHRLHTIRHADRIYVLDQGTIIQQGTYAELAGQPGMFSELIKRQKL